MTFGLEYSPRIDENVIRTLEQAGRDCGISLNELELLGQDVNTALGFVDAHRDGYARQYMAKVDWSYLERCLMERPDPVQAFRLK